MIFKGKYNTAAVMTEIIDENAKTQVQAMCDNPVFEGLNICIMPDVHAGAGCTIGTTMTLKDKVVPNMVGVDIGCGMEVVKLNDKKIDFEKLDKLIYSAIPSGQEVRERPHKFAEQIELSALNCFGSVNADRAYKSVGTLGGGNHFIEVDRDGDGGLYLVVHSGSRHLGVEVAEQYQREAYKNLSGNSRWQLDELIAHLKSEGREREIESAIQSAKAKKPNIDPDTAWCEGKLFEDYIHDMKIVQFFAALNRRAMVEEILDWIGLEEGERCTTIHNYIDTEHMILRKGAVSAQSGERLIIPINMRDGSLICTGKGNAEWNFSAPHGAGRILSRNQARATLSVEEFQRQMQGIYTTSVSAVTLDESPMAYKSIGDIVNNIAPTVEIEKRILPVYNFKAAEDAQIKRRR